MSSRYTHQQVTAIIQLRKNVEDLKLDEDRNSDSQLVKWLIVQNFNIQKAEAMLRKSLIWWKENDMDNILEWMAPEEMKHAIPLRVCGHDVEGNTVLITQMKEADPNILYKIDKAVYVKFRVQLVVKLLKEMKARNKRLGLTGDQFISIHDLDGFSLKSVLNSKMLDLMSEVTHTLEDNFPESVKMAFITHAPKMITYAMFIIRPLTPKTTMAKLKIFDSNSSKWGAELLKHIPPSQLPPKYGGNNVEFENSQELTVQA